MPHYLISVLADTDTNRRFHKLHFHLIQFLQFGNFAAFDIKLANSESSSICSIAFAIVRNNEIVQKFHSYVRPEPLIFDKSDDDRITEEMVREAPTLPEVWEQIKNKIDGLPMVSFMGLDKVVLQEAFAHYNMRDPESEHKFVNICEAAQPILGNEIP